MGFMIEKSVQVTDSTKYANYYSPNLICNCDDECKYRNDDLSLKKSQLDSNFKVYRNNKIIDMDSITSNEEVYPSLDDRNELDYSLYQEKLLNNLTCYIKLLTLNEDIKNKEENTSYSQVNNNSYDFHTCNETTFSIVPFRLNQSICLKIDNSSIEEMLKFLDKADPVHIQKAIKHILKRDPITRIFTNFSNLNKRLFNSHLTGIITRWTTNCHSKTEFDLEETCQGSLIWCIKLNQNSLSSESSETILRYLLFEMTLAYLNIVLNSMNLTDKDDIIKKFDYYLNLILLKISKITLLKFGDLLLNKKLFLYNFNLVDNASKANHKFKIMSFNKDEKVLLDQNEEDEENRTYETVNFKRENQYIPADYSQDYIRLKSITQQLIDSITEDLFKQKIFTSTFNDPHAHEYENLQDFFSHDGTIIKSDTMQINELTVTNLVQSPYKKCKNQATKSKTKPVKQTDLNNNNNSNNLTDLNMLNWIKKLETDFKLSERRSLPSNLNDLKDFSDKEEDDSYEENQNRVDENVLVLRNTLFSFVNTSLKNLIISPLKLYNFRRSLVYVLNINEPNSIEQFVLELFEFISNNLFSKLLQSVRIEWSYRLRSTAASTVLVKNNQETSIVIRLSWNLLNRLSRVDLLKILLHEMIHAYLGLSIGDFIEHDYEETLDLAYIWACSKCNQKRIRFYNIPPTENQIVEHASRCDGTFKIIKEPNLEF